ncbi:MAG: T9SS type A sorting domain-containing protein [Melioribacteraceae bacterium]
MNYSFRYKKSFLLITLFFINNITSLFAQWEKTSCPATSPSSFAVSDTCAYVSSGENIWRSFDNCGSWELFNINVADAKINDLMIDGDIIYVSTNKGVYYSKLTGNDWQLLNSIFDNKKIRNVRSDSGVLYVIPSATVDIYKSVDGGKNWKIINNGISGLYVTSFIALNNELYITTIDGVFISTDSGEKWIKTNSYIGSYIVSSVKVDSLFFAGKYYSGGFQSEPPQSDGGIVVSKDMGKNWARLTITSYERRSIKSLSYKDSVLYSSSVDRIMISRDRGITFREMEIPVTVRNFSWTYPDEKYLYVANSNDGLWRIKRADITTSINKDVRIVSDDYRLKQNYPNPFNPSTVIEYSLNKDSYVKLSIINVLGKELAVLVNGEKKKGFYSEKFDGGSLSSGVYFCVLRTNNNVETRKMILLK